MNLILKNVGNCAFSVITRTIVSGYELDETNEIAFSEMQTLRYYAKYMPSKDTKHCPHLPARVLDVDNEVISVEQTLPAY